MIIALPLLWFGSGLAYFYLSERAYRFRVTAEVETPQGLRTGSSVVDFRVYRNPSWLPPGGGTVPYVTGEAVFVDLGMAGGRHGNLIALLAYGPTGADPNYYLMPARAFLPVPGHQGTLAFGDFADRLEALPIGSRAELIGSNIPTLVTFDDLNNPLTARVVAPDRLAEEFGAGYDLKRIWIEKVSRGWWPASALGLSGVAISSRIEGAFAWWGKPLPWMKPLLNGGPPLDARPVDQSQYRLMTTDFKRGV
ncbi:MAG: hypothetical protein JSS20_05675 [Proteobacteria bacterium]|nr:hypothetical protein [Pseudomonadota bacterium]